MVDLLKEIVKTTSVAKIPWERIFSVKLDKMKTLKKIGIVLLAIILLLVILGLFVISPNTHVSQERTFDVPKAYAFNLMNNMKNVPLYNTWVIEDPEMELTFSDNSIGHGANYMWSSPTSGSGKIVFNKVVDQDSIIAAMIFEGMGESTIKYVFEEVKGKTKMTWMMDTNLGFPYNLMKWIMKYQIKSSYDKSFDKIDKILNARKQGTYYGYEVTPSLRSEMYYIMNRDQVAFDNIQKFYTQNLGAIYQRIQNEGIVVSGAPSGLFFNMDMDKGVIDMAASLPVNEAIEVEGLTSYTTPSSQVLTVDYYGDYDKTDKAHEAIDAYISDRGLLHDAPVIEEYVTDPIQEKDPQKWLTKIVYYVADKN